MTRRQITAIPVFAIVFDPGTGPRLFDFCPDN